MPEPRTVAIIGAGFSGVMTAAHLLQAKTASPIRVVMLNRSGASARGVAYGTKSPNHLLNVPAARMSAYPDRPGHFLEFAKSRDATVEPGTFVRRSLYGEYLEALLLEAAEGSNFLDRLVAEVKTIRTDASGATLETVDGRSIRCDQVVLAVGHYAPAHPAGIPAEVLDSDRYIRDPWARGALDRLPTDRPAILIGTGLTMLDVALDLKTRGFAGAIAISRRGLLPRPHDPSIPHAEVTHRPPGVEYLHSTRAFLTALRKQVNAVEAAGGNWRQVIDSLRPITPQLWRQLSVREQQRFLQAVRPYWDAHRHRAAPQVSAAIEASIAEGWLAIRPGRIADCNLTDTGVTLAFQPRGTHSAASLAGGSIINCTGPSSSATEAGDPLVAELFARKLARPDPLGIGLEVTLDGAVIGADGNVSKVMSYVGPLLRARDGEGTAVPELRVHAAQLARRLIGWVESEGGAKPEEHWYAEL